MDVPAGSLLHQQLVEHDLRRQAASVALEGKDSGRVDLRGNVYWLTDRGGGKCSREAIAQLLRARRNLTWVWERLRRTGGTGLTDGQGVPRLILLIDYTKSRGTNCFHRSRQA